MPRCQLCRAAFSHRQGHGGHPLAEGQVCQTCFLNHVLPARMRLSDANCAAQHIAAKYPDQGFRAHINDKGHLVFMLAPATEPQFQDPLCIEVNDREFTLHRQSGWLNVEVSPCQWKSDSWTVEGQPVEPTPTKCSSPVCRHCGETRPQEPLPPGVEGSSDAPGSTARGSSSSA